MTKANIHNGQRMISGDAGLQCSELDCNAKPFTSRSNPNNKHLRTTHKIEPTTNARPRKRKRANIEEQTPATTAIDVIVDEAETDTSRDREVDGLSDASEDVVDFDSDSDVDEDEEESVEIRNNIDQISGSAHRIALDKDGDWNKQPASEDPYKNPQTLVMMCLYNGYSNTLSRSQLKTFLNGINKFVDLAIDATKRKEEFTMPTANKILKGDEGKKYDGPKVNV